MDIENEIRSIKERLVVLESLKVDLDRLKFGTTDLPKIAGVPVVNTPTATGYVPFIINGKRVNLMVGS